MAEPVWYPMPPGTRTRWEAYCVIVDTGWFDVDGNVLIFPPSDPVVVLRREGRTVGVPVPARLIADFDFPVWDWIKPRARYRWRKALAQRDDSR